MAEPLLASTPNDELTNLRQIASELADKPDLVKWAMDNADISTHVGQIHKLYPWLPAGVTLALGSARYDPSDPFVGEIAKAALKFGRAVDSKIPWNPGFTSQPVQSAVDQAMLGTTIGGVTPQEHGGLLDRVVGDVTGAASHVARDIGGAVPETLRSGVKDVSRFTFAGLQSGLETVNAGIRQIRAVHQAEPGLSAETYGPEHGPLGGGTSTPNKETYKVAPLLPQITLVHMINGEGSGQGYFPSGPAAKNAVAAQEAAGSILGPDGQAHAITFGRGIAGSLIPTNSPAFGLISGMGDAAFDWYADPAQKALGEVGALREARAGVAAEGTHWGTEGGVFDRLRQVIGVQTASEQLDSRVGQGIIQKLTTMDTVNQVFHFLGKKVDPAIAAQLADATTPEEVRAVLDSVLGTGLLGQLPTFHPAVNAATSAVAQKLPWNHVTDAFGNPVESGLPSLGYSVDRAVRQWRPAAELPGGWLPTDLTQSWTRKEAYRQAEAFMLNAKVSADEMDPVLHRIATATNRWQMLDAAKLMSDTVGDRLTRVYGWAPEDARKIVRLYGMPDEVTDLVKHLKIGLEDNIHLPGILVDGEPVPFNWAAPTEMLQNNIPLPDFRAIRRAASMRAKVLQAIPGGTKLMKVEEVTAAALDAAQHTWKFTQLARPAFIVRVGMDAQLSLAAAGDASAMTHPFHFLAWMLGTGAGKVTKKLGDSGYLESKAQKLEPEFIKYGRGEIGATGFAGEEVGKLDYNKVFQVGTGLSQVDRQRIYANQWTHLTRDMPGFTDAWAQEIRHVSLDDLLRATAKAMIGDPEARGARNVEELKQAFWDGHLHNIRLNMIESDPKAWQTYLFRRDISDWYIDQEVTRLRAYAQNDPELLQAMATGKFRGEPLAHVAESGNQRIGAGADRAPQILRDHLAELNQSGIAPPFMKSFLHGQTHLGPGAQMSDLLDKAARRSFQMMNTLSLRELTASSAFRQEYFKYGEDLLPFMDPAEAVKAVANAEKAGIHGLDASVAHGTLDAQTMSMIAKSKALDRMGEILHDLGHRKQWSDMLRFVFPFGDAYQKIITRWANLVADNPRTIERLRQGVMGAEGSSFVHTDPQSGKLVLTVPLSLQADKLIAGVPFPMSAPLNGLSVVGSGLPGVGPAVSIPLAAIAPHVPVAQQLMRTFSPYGSPNIQQGLLEAFLPAWAQKWRTASTFASADQKSVFAHSVGEVLRWGVSTGKYKVDTPEHITQAVADARHRAKLLWFVRGAIQSTFPSAPSVDAMVKDKNGKMLNAYVLTNELQNLYSGKGIDGKGHNDPAQAAQIFLKLHGEQNYLVMQPFTTPRRYGLPTTASATEWLSKHPEFRSRYPDIYGLLTPQKGAFDYSTYVGQIHSGERVDRTPTEFVQLANARIAQMIYDQERDKLPDDASAADKSNYLGQLREWLKVHYPGFRDNTLDVQKLDVADAINQQLIPAVNDRLVARTPAAVATRQYLAMRQQVIDFEKQNGAKTTSNALSKSAEFAPQNEWLSAQASALISQYPEFFPVWDQLLSHEVTLPSPTTPTPVGQ